MGTYPMLEVGADLICDTLAIAQYIVRCSKNSAAKSLLGSSAVEEAQVEQWFDYLRTETYPIVQALKMYTFGYAACNADTLTQMQNEFKDNIKVLNVALQKTSCFVGNETTLADIYFALTQVEMQQGIMDVNLRNSCQFVNTTFKKIGDMPEFKSRMGAIRQGKK